MLLLKNHTSILESTLNIVKNDHSSLQKQINHFNALTEAFKNRTNAIETEERLQNFFIYLTQIIDEYDRQQSAIIEVISDSKRNFISHELFTVSQIENQVEIITKQMGTEYHVPSGIEVYSVSKISVYRIKNQFVFKISIPLLNAQKYKLYKILPIPTIHENKFVWINTKEKLLLASVNRQFYQFIKDMANCIPYGNKQVICDNPTFWYTSTKPNCIWDIFNHLPREKCKIYETPSEPFVAGLDNNQFIYVLSNPIKITIVCGDTVTHDWLKGEGMLSLQPQCMISNDNMQLNSKSSFGNVSELIVPNLKIVREWALSLSTSREQIMNNITLGSANFTELERKIN